MMIFFLFEPLNIKEQKFKDVPLFEMSSFKLLEFSQDGLVTLMLGDSAIRYKNRYEVSKMDYTDNAKQYKANIKANKGLYQGDNINLKGDVIYTRDDGLTFESQAAEYNKKTKVAYTNSDYVSYQGKNRVIGASLIYNNLEKKIESKQIVAKYQLKKSKGK